MLRQVQLLSECDDSAEVWRTHTQVLIKPHRDLSFKSSNKILKSYHASLCHRTQITDPNLYVFLSHCRMLRSTAWPMQTRSSVVLRFGGNPTFKTTCESSRALRDMTTAHTPGCSFWKQSATVWVITPRLSRWRPKMKATGILMLRARREFHSTCRCYLHRHRCCCILRHVRGVLYQTLWQGSAGTMWAFSILLQLCGW